MTKSHLFFVVFKFGTRKCACEYNKLRSKDLGALLDTCSWYDEWEFRADLY